MSYKTMITTVGFLLAGLGFLSLILSMIGIQLSFLVWIDGAGKALGFVVKVLMIVFGVIMIYLTRSDFSGEIPL